MKELTRNKARWQAGRFIRPISQLPPQKWAILNCFFKGWFSETHTLPCGTPIRSHSAGLQSLQRQSLGFMAMGVGSFRKQTPTNITEGHKHVKRTIIYRFGSLFLLTGYHTFQRGLCVCVLITRKGARNMEWGHPWSYISSKTFVGSLMLNCMTHRCFY